MLIDLDAFDIAKATPVAAPVSFRAASPSVRAKQSLMANPVFMIGMIPIMAVAWAGMAVWIGVHAAIGILAKTATPRRGVTE